MKIISSMRGRSGRNASSLIACGLAHLPLGEVFGAGDFRAGGSVSSAQVRVEMHRAANYEDLRRDHKSPLDDSCGQCNGVPAKDAAVLCFRRRSRDDSDCPGGGSAEGSARGYACST